MCSCFSAARTQPLSLHAAAAADDCDALRARLDTARARGDAGACAGARDASGDTPLHAASLVGATSAAALLLACGADANATNGHGQTPVHLACMAPGRGALVRALLAAGGAPGAATRRHGRAPLHNAAEFADADVAAALLAAGAPPRPFTHSGVAPLALAERRVDAEGDNVARLIRQAEWDAGLAPTLATRTPLHHGEDGGQLEIGRLYC